MDEAAWVELRAAISAAPYPVEVFAVDPERAQSCSAALGTTSPSWLGAVVANTGGVAVDHGWLRVLGSGHDVLPDVVTQTAAATGRLTVGLDVLGGQFAWMPTDPGASSTVQYFGPEDLAWQDLEVGYEDWLHAMLSGSMTSFYATVRWAGWEAETAAVVLDHGISTYPPLWTTQGKDISTASRRPVKLAELVALHEDMARQLDGVAPLTAD